MPIVLAAAFFTEVWWTVDGQIAFPDERLGGWTHMHTYTAHGAPPPPPPPVPPPSPRTLRACPAPALHRRALAPVPAFPQQSTDFRFASAHAPRPKRMPPFSTPWRPARPRLPQTPPPVILQCNVTARATGD
ncbi:hypothetical protein JB92DRAFT_3130695 [Gautieria morchelliformis]|nr:hypothetical protein JB92DRAFT_3130695 [Gautieria morchelliformis]